MLSNTMQRAGSILNLLGPELEGPSETQLRMIFRVFDRDCDGFITGEEIANALRSMGKRPLTKKIQTILEECDKEETGKIGIQQFVDYFIRKAAEKREKKNKSGDAASSSSSSSTAASDDAAPTDSSQKKTAKEPKKATKKKTAAVDTASVPPAAPYLHRTSSILDFYSENAGSFPAAAASSGSSSSSSANAVLEDLGLPDAFKEYKILIGEFSPIPTIEDVIVPALRRRKGFTVNSTQSERKFAEELTESEYDLAWIISGNEVQDGSSAQFAQAVLQFHESGGGLFVWAGEAPLLAHANLAVAAILGQDFQLSGSKSGPEQLNQRDSLVADEAAFVRHLITTGLRTLSQAPSFAGVDNISNKLAIIAGTTTSPSILASAIDTFPPYCGRIVLDLAQSKLGGFDSEFSHPDLLCYILNASCWAVGIDLREAHCLPLRGRLSRANHDTKWIWQYFHGGWFNYDTEANDRVEAEYQNFLQSNTGDVGVRSVQSGFFRYSINFRTMKQRNIVHPAHTERDIRRIQETAYTWDQ